MKLEAWSVAVPPLGDGKRAQATEREGFAGGVMVTTVLSVCAEAGAVVPTPRVFLRKECGTV